MVFHYTNYVIETNIWWIRRIRPFIVGGVGGWLAWLQWRYYFLGKNQAKWSRMDTEDEWKRRAQLNKRSYGYNAHYEPELERSMKKVLYSDPNYQFPINWVDRYTGDTRTLEQIMEDENEKWSYYR